MTATRQENISRMDLEKVREELRKLPSRKARVNLREAQQAARVQKQARKDAWHRKYAGFGALEAAMPLNPKLKEAVFRTIKPHIRERERYLFPELWPDAVRPQLKKRPEQATQIKRK